MAPQKRKSAYLTNDDFVVSDDGANATTSTPAPKRSKKTSSPQLGSSATKKDEDGNIYWEISKARRVTLSEFNKKKMVSVREYYEKDGKWLPGKKGISMTLDQYAAFVEVLPAIEKELRRRGVEDVPRPRYDGGDHLKNNGNDTGDGDDDGETESEADGGGGRRNFEATSDEGE